MLRLNNTIITNFFSALILFIFEFLKKNSKKTMTLNKIQLVLTIFILSGSFKVFPQAIKIQHSSISDQANLANQKLTFKIIESINDTWGYDILNEEKVMIHQASVPGQAGLEGFKTKEQAIMVANAIIEKINKGIKPPSISLEEMKLLGAL